MRHDTRGGVGKSVPRWGSSTSLETLAITLAITLRPGCFVPLASPAGRSEMDSLVVSSFKYFPKRSPYGFFRDGERPVHHPVLLS